MLVPDESHAAYNQPPGYMCVYEISLHCGWRLPVAKSFLDILDYLELAPNQIILNSLGNLMCFVVVCKRLDIPLSPETFKKVFDVQASEAHFPFFQFRVRPNFTFFDAPISSLGIYWWKRYFFVRPALKEGESK